MLQKKRYADIKAGESADFSKTISEVDIVLFAGICGDFNPIHVNKDFARNSFFRERVAHGMLTASLLSTVVAEVLGSGGIYLSQNLKFTAPVRLGDTITAHAEIIEKIPKNRVRLKTICMNQDGKTVVDGEAVGFTPE
jgi:3-hydroxybutyryl-CoA dehydratase